MQYTAAPNQAAGVGTGAKNAIMAFNTKPIEIRSTSKPNNPTKQQQHEEEHSYS
jgi:hypothetical protein